MLVFSLDMNDRISGDTTTFQTRRLRSVLTVMSNLVMEEKDLFS